MTMRAAPQLPPAYLWLAPAIGLACIGTLATAADLGTTAYWSPFSPCWPVVSAF